MPQLTKNQEYCSIARALSVLGERWTLLIIRDLLSGPKRFGELEQLVVGITPKWLTVRLRSLETAGLVTRTDREYHLTDGGEGLRDVLESLSMWAASFDSRPPDADEVIVPAHDMWALEVYLNRGRIEWPESVRWTIHLTDDRDYEMSFDGAVWRWHPDPPTSGDVAVMTTKRAWSTLLANAQAGRPTPRAEFQLTGERDQVEQFEKLANLAW